MGVDWGSVPAWVGALGTTLGVFWAATTLRTNERNRERSQASAIHLVVRPLIDPVRDGPAPAAQAVSARLHNRSAAPIYSYGWYVVDERGGELDRSFGGEVLESGTKPSHYTDGWQSGEARRFAAEFKDADGRWWRRWDNGSLERLRGRKADAVDEQRERDR